MNQSWNRYGVMVLVAVLAIGALVFMSRQQPAFGYADDKPTSGPRYTVVETEGHNLLVTDNGTNTLYFYAVDKGEPVGSELKMRGKLDLNQVGKPSIKPVTTKKDDK
jgi:hypothetical protein